jgi:3',5'-cyclic AMP phosphodiesterase CpdA
VELAHVSDLHLRWERGAAGVPVSGYLNKRVLGWLNLTFHRSHPPEIAAALLEDLRERPPDHLALTGDVTNLALPGEFDQARAWLEGTGLSAERVSLIPGNHDTYTRDSVGAFEDVFDAWLGAGASWPRIQRVGPLLLVSTTSCVPTPWFQAWGRMGEEQLAAIEDALRTEAPLKVVLVHHPPLLAKGRPEKRRRGNQDAEALLALCRGQADLVLCGHTHRAFHHVVEGPRPLHVLCAGSTTSLPRALGIAATYNRYRFVDGVFQGYEVRGFDPDAGRFAHVRDVSNTPTLSR